MGGAVNVARAAVGKPRIRWAPRLPPRLLERLYQADAGGLRDTELCEEVGVRLFARCRAFVLVSEWEVECPACRGVFAVARQGRSLCPTTGCAFLTDPTAYRTSLQNHYVYPGRAMDAFRRFFRGYPKTKTYADKILMIDELIHAFHIDEATGTPVKSLASKLLEGNKNEAVQLLDRLSAVDASTKERWRETVAGTIHGRLFGEGGGGTSQQGPE